MMNMDIATLDARDGIADSSILVCTVGGSHEPIVQAIEEASPAYVCFFCTDRDQNAAQEGSISEIADISRKARLADSQFEYKIVPADDLDQSVRSMRTAIDELHHRHPNRRICADYTGGTKTMTAALVVAALEFKNVELQLVSGPRDDLRSVKAGMASTLRASDATLRMRQEMRLHLKAWRHFGYSEAEAGLRKIRAISTTPEMNYRQMTLNISLALWHWDSFNHKEASERLRALGKYTNKHYPALLPTICTLTGDTPKRTPALLFDLWLNAERRASQGRYDDAVARWYRLMEWTAQWQIKKHLDAETSNFPADILPSEAVVHPGPDGKLKVSLINAWKILHAQGIEPCHTFFKNQESTLLNHLSKRNDSILAHGFTPVSRADWKGLAEWTRQHFLPMLERLAKDAGLKKRPDQLPTRPPDLE